MWPLASASLLGTRPSANVQESTLADLAIHLLQQHPAILLVRPTLMRPVACRSTGDRLTCFYFLGVSCFATVLSRLGISSPAHAAPTVETRRPPQLQLWRDGTNDGLTVTRHVVRRQRRRSSAKLAN